MFRYKRSILSVFVILLIAFTWLIAYLTADSPWPDALWYQMSGIWIGEALLGAVVIGLYGNTDRTLPIHTGNLLIGVLYLVYALSMLALTCSDQGVLLWEIGGLIVALLAHTFFIFVRHDLKGDAAAEKKAFDLRGELLTTLEMFEVSHREAIGGDAALAKEFGKLKDAARFVSDSGPGGESADEEVRSGLAALRQCSDAESMTRAAVELAARIGVRENVMKRLR